MSAKSMFLTLTLGAVGTLSAATANAADSAGAQLALVAGGTGRTGVHVVRELLEGGYRVRVLARNPEAARKTLDARVAIVRGDVGDAASLPAALEGVTFVISSVGSGGGQDKAYTPEAVDYRGGRNLVEAAKAARVRHFVLISAMGITQPDHPLNRVANNVLLWKGLGENALRFSGIDYTIVRPGALLDGPRGTKNLIASQGDGFREWGRPRNELPAIDRADLATVVVRSLGRPELFGRTLEIASVPGAAPQDWNAFFSGLKPDLNAALPR